MSRAYRIAIKDRQTRIVRGIDEVSTVLELMPILSPEETANLLRERLHEHGFTQLSTDAPLERTQGAITVSVDPCSGKVSLRAEVSKHVNIETTVDAEGFDDMGPSLEQVREMAEQQAKEDLGKKIKKAEEGLESAASELLENKLTELHGELNQIANEVTRLALKRKAEQVGRIIAIHEDATTGEMTIQLEV